MRHVAALQQPRKNFPQSGPQFPAQLIPLSLLRTSVLLLPHCLYRSPRTPGIVLLIPQCVSSSFFRAGGVFVACPRPAISSSSAAAKPPAAGRAMIRTYGSEPSVNQKVLLPSFMQSYGAFHADQCCVVCYAILTPPPLCLLPLLFLHMYRTLSVVCTVRRSERAHPWSINLHGLRGAQVW